MESNCSLNWFVSLVPLLLLDEETCEEGIKLQRKRSDTDTDTDTRCSALQEEIQQRIRTLVSSTICLMRSLLPRLAVSSTSLMISIRSPVLAGRGRGRREGEHDQNC